LRDTFREYTSRSWRPATSGVFPHTPGYQADINIEIMALNYRKRVAKHLEGRGNCQQPYRSYGNPFLDSFARTESRTSPTFHSWQRLALRRIAGFDAGCLASRATALEGGVTLSWPHSMTDQPLP
jgi:hypothetical protein